MLVSSLLCFPFNFFVPMLVIWGAMFCTSLLVPIRFSAWHCLCNLCLFVHTCALLVIFQAFLFFCRHRWCQLVHFVFFFAYPLLFQCQYFFMAETKCVNLFIIVLSLYFLVPIPFYVRQGLYELAHHHCALVVLFRCKCFFMAKTICVDLFSFVLFLYFFVVDTICVSFLVVFQCR